MKNILIVLGWALLWAATPLALNQLIAFLMYYSTETGFWEITKEVWKLENSFLFVVMSPCLFFLGIWHNVSRIIKGYDVGSRIN